MEAVRQENQQFRDELTKLPNPVDYEAVRDKQSLLQTRDRILKTWRLTKGPEKKERIKEALDRFIEELHRAE